MISEMIMASFSKIWHLIPIAIAIVLFKIFINNQDKKKRILKNEENEKNGLGIQIRTRKKYEDMGYNVQETKTNDDAIDFILTKENKTLLIQCNNTTQIKSITEEDIKTFYKNAINYVKTNSMEEHNMELRFVIPYKDVLHKSAVKIFADDSYGCKYVVV